MSFCFFFAWSKATASWLFVVDVTELELEKDAVHVLANEQWMRYQCFRQGADYHVRLDPSAQSFSNESTAFLDMSQHVRVLGCIRMFRMLCRYPPFHFSPR